MLRAPWAFGTFMISRPNLGCSHWLKFVYTRMLSWRHFARASNWVKNITSLFSIIAGMDWDYLFRRLSTNFMLYIYLLSGNCQQENWSQLLSPWLLQGEESTQLFVLVWDQACYTQGILDEHQNFFSYYEPEYKFEHVCVRQGNGLTKGELIRYLVNISSKSVK